MIELEITPQGGIAMLHDDAVDLAQFGDVDVRRASYVEWANGADEYVGSLAGVPSDYVLLPKGWYVQSARSGIFLKAGFQTRAEALAWEKAWYSPSGAGWKELTERR